MDKDNFKNINDMMHDMLIKYPPIKTESPRLPLGIKQDRNMEKNDIRSLLIFINHDVFAIRRIIETFSSGIYSNNLSLNCHLFFGTYYLRMDMNYIIHYEYKIDRLFAETVFLNINTDTYFSCISFRYNPFKSMNQLIKEMYKPYINLIKKYNKMLATPKLERKPVVGYRKSNGVIFQIDEPEYFDRNFFAPVFKTKLPEINSIIKFN